LYHSERLQGAKNIGLLTLSHSFNEILRRYAPQNDTWFYRGGYHGFFN
jgi:hypothetical protein